MARAIEQKADCHALLVCDDAKGCLIYIVLVETPRRHVSAHRRGVSGDAHDWVGCMAGGIPAGAIEDDDDCVSTPFLHEGEYRTMCLQWYSFADSVASFHLPIEEFSRTAPVLPLMDQSHCILRRVIHRLLHPQQGDIPPFSIKSIIRPAVGGGRVFRQGILRVAVALILALQMAQAVSLAVTLGRVGAEDGILAEDDCKNQ